MIDLQSRTEACPYGRIMLAKVADLLFEAMLELPNDVDPQDPYLRAILHRDIIEAIAKQMEIGF